MLSRQCWSPNDACVDNHGDNRNNIDDYDHDDERGEAGGCG